MSERMPAIDQAAIIRMILGLYSLHPRGLHGVTHWARVLENGLKLASETGADPTIVTLFALYHDSRRETDNTDWGHGQRGAQLAMEHRGTYFQLCNDDFATLYFACEWHTDRVHDENVTVATCWDADRLDLARVGVHPDRRFLTTAAAKQASMIAWATQRAQADFEPELVRNVWQVKC